MLAEEAFLVTYIRAGLLGQLELSRALFGSLLVFCLLLRVATQMAQIATLSKRECVTSIYVQYKGDRARALSAAAGDELAPHWKVFADVIDDFKSLGYLPAYPDIEYKGPILLASWTVEGSSVSCSIRCTVYGFMFTSFVDRKLKYFSTPW